MEDLANRVVELKSKNDQLHEKKIRLEERLKSEKSSLAKVIKEIKEKGYDPKKLKETVQEKEEKLKEMILSYEHSLEEAEKLLAEIEKNDNETTE